MTDHDLPALIAKARASVAERAPRVLADCDTMDAMFPLKVGSRFTGDVRALVAQLRSVLDALPKGLA